MREIRARLEEARDEAFGAFQRKLLPSLKADTILGVRTPDLKRLAREMAGKEGTAAFLDALPHRYFEENQLHAFIIAEEKDFSRCLCEVERFLPYVDNWATCDQLSPRVFGKHREELLPAVMKWLDSESAYTVRFALGMLMRHYLDGGFDPAYLEKAAKIRSNEYYVNMMQAWFFATALAKRYDAALPFIQRLSLPAWAHNKAIQKASESRRLTAEQKEELKKYRLSPKKEAVSV